MPVQKRRYIEWTLYVFIFIAFYALNRFSPFICDDYYYAFVMRDGMFNGEACLPIRTLSDIIDSQVWAYYHHNGRFIVHSIVQLFCGIWGIEYFVLVNSLIFLFLVIGVVRLLRCVRPAIMVDSILVYLLLMIFVPIVGKTYLGNISFSVNYLWSSCAIVWWYFFYLKIKNSNAIINCILLIFSVIVGSMQESFSIGIAAALGIYYVLNFGELKGTTTYLVLGFIIGTTFVTFAPANFMRFANEQGSTHNCREIILQTARVLLSLRVFWLLLLYLVIIFVRKGCKFFLSLINQNVVLILACLINILFAAIVAMNGKHQLVCVELLSLILLLSYMRLHCPDCIYNGEGIAIILCSLMLIVIYIPIYDYRKEFYTAHQELLNSAKEGDGGVIMSGKYEQLCFSARSKFLSRYVMKEHYWDYNKYGLSLMLSNGRSISYVSAVLPDSPKNLVATCVDENKVTDYVYKKDTDDYYVLRIESEQKSLSKVEVFLQPGFAGRYLYKFFHVDPRGADSKMLSLISLNKFYQDGFMYVVVSDSSPIMSLRVI